MQMTGWTFEDAIAAIQSPHSIPISVLLSTDGLRLRDICFAKIQTTLHMWTIPITVLEKSVADGSFNLEHMAEGDYSCSTAILILLNPNKEGTVLKSASIRLIIRWHMGPVGQVNDITKLMMYARSLMNVEWQSSDTACRTFCTIVGDYGSHMGFVTDPPFCMAYPLSFVHKDDPAQMTFRSQQNHPISFTADVLLVHQLLAWDCSSLEYAMNRHHRHLLIPRGCIFYPTSFHRLLFLMTTWYHAVIPGQEMMFHLLPLAHLQICTCYSLAQLAI